jgi:hypothetical protein
MQTNSLQESYLPKEKNNPKRKVVPIKKIEAWEAVGYRAIGNVIHFPGQEDGVFWKEVVYLEKNEKELTKSKEDNKSVMDFISEIQSFIQKAQARANVSYAAANQYESSDYSVDSHDLSFVLKDQKDHLEHIAKVISKLEFKYSEDHNDQATSEIRA